MIEEFFSLNEVTYHALEAGKGDPLMLLHGFTGSAASWGEHLDHFAASRRVIALDLIGHGNTDSPPDANRYSFDHVAADLRALLTTLDVNKVDLLGYSMGGRVALYYALKYPDTVQSLIIEAADAGIERHDERAARQATEKSWAGIIRDQGLPAFIEFWENVPIFATQKRLSADMQAHLREHRLNHNPAGLAHAVVSLGVGSQPPLWNRLSELHMPILYLVGSLDAKFSAIGQRVKQMLPAAQLQIIPDSGHNVHLEQPDLFRQAVDQFLNTRV